MRFFGEVGYGTPVETPPGSGVWVNVITERTYQGDVLRDTRNLTEPVEGDNSNINISNLISIVSDQYALDSFMNIKYVRWVGVLWIVTSVEVRRPRLILTIGGVYNDPTP